MTGASVPVTTSQGIPDLLKLIGSYALAKLLFGFGLVGAIVIYALLSLLT